MLEETASFDGLGEQTDCVGGDDCGCATHASLRSEAGVQTTMNGSGQVLPVETRVSFEQPPEVSAANQRAIIMLLSGVKEAIKTRLTSAQRTEANIRRILNAVAKPFLVIIYGAYANPNDAPLGAVALGEPLIEEELARFRSDSMADVA